MAPLPRYLTFCLFVTLTGVACERKQRAREREAGEEKARAEKVAREAARREAEPMPEEPPVELLRVKSSGFPCEVDDVFARKCRRCHTVPTRHGAPFVFLTWEDTRQDRLGQPLYTVIGRAVSSGFMPYKMEANPPVQPLTEDEKKIIVDWVAAGAPKAACDPDAPTEKKVAPASEKSARAPTKAAPAPKSATSAP
ncbi:MAG: hypothetical protein EOO73_24960 [Myxococcales bacterium]|nr:MAG: hypothetical protein EOO73_24960 [Myxococcales bacterium]